jgi:hypothetical protein
VARHARCAAHSVSARSHATTAFRLRQTTAESAALTTHGSTFAIPFAAGANGFPNGANSVGALGPESEGALGGGVRTHRPAAAGAVIAAGPGRVAIHSGWAESFVAESIVLNNPTQPISPPHGTRTNWRQNWRHPNNADPVTP